MAMTDGATGRAAEVRRMRAVFLAALGATADDVEAELERAIEVAKHHGALTFELRARDTLDRLRAGTEEHDLRRDSRLEGERDGNP
jgi:hypothetical protein